MGKKSKAKKGGKQYDDDPGCRYVVVEQPWPDWGQATKTNLKRYFDHIGAWLWYATNKTILPLELYHVGTRNEVIIRYDSNANVASLLGEHSWEGFDKKPAPPGRRSYVFEYDYGTKGHPDDHQWMSHPFQDFSKDTQLREGALPVRQPYPAPVWADCRERMRSCKDLAVPMVKPREVSATPASPSPQPPQAPTQTQYTSTFGGLAELFPDRPPPPPPQSSEPARRALSLPPPGRLFTSKLDPEDEEEELRRLLKTEPAGDPATFVKQEPGAAVKVEQDGVSEEKINAAYAEYAKWEQSRTTPTMPASEATVKREAETVERMVKPEPASQEPSKDLEQAYAEYQRQQRGGENNLEEGEVHAIRHIELPTPAVRVKAEPLGGRSSISSNAAITVHDRPLIVKTEPNAAAQVKPEPLDDRAGTDPRTRYTQPSQQSVPMKREPDGDHRDVAKKRRN